MSFFFLRHSTCGEKRGREIDFDKMEPCLLLQAFIEPILDLSVGKDFLAKDLASGRLEWSSCWFICCKRRAAELVLSRPPAAPTEPDSWAANPLPGMASPTILAAMKVLCIRLCMTCELGNECDG
jgi:hypothetical protein